MADIVDSWKRLKAPTTGTGPSARSSPSCKNAAKPESLQRLCPASARPWQAEVLHQVAGKGGTLALLFMLEVHEDVLAAGLQACNLSSPVLDIFGLITFVPQPEVSEAGRHFERRLQL